MRDPRQSDGYMQVANSGHPTCPGRRCHINSTPVVERPAMRQIQPARIEIPRAPHSRGES